MRTRLRDAASLFLPQLFLLPYFAIGMASYGVHFSVKFIPFDIFVLGVIKEFGAIICSAVLVVMYGKVSSD